MRWATQPFSLGERGGRDEEADAARLAGLLEGGLGLGAAVHLDGLTKKGMRAIRRSRKPAAVVAVARVWASSTSQWETTSRAVKCWSTTVKGGEKVYRCGEQKCLTGMMRKNQIEIWAGLGQEQGSPVLETVDIYGRMVPASDAQASAALEQVLRLRLQCCG